jgi:23S rRNA-/tRNA-specific pseudouridylate synthase
VVRTESACTAFDYKWRRVARKRKSERVDDGDLFASPPDLEHDYVVLDGVRLVRPYAFDFVCHVKRRQAGLDVVEAFAREFPGRPRSYYEAAHKTGLLRVEKAAPAKNKPSGKKTGATRKRCRAEEAGEPEEATERTEPTASPTALSRKTSSDGKKNEPEIEPLRPLHAGERIRHYLHRHEPPTLSDPVTVLAATESMVAVYKPATVPVHPTGQYRKNTVLGLMAASRPDLGRLLPVHRLDKNVSGLLLMARDAASANRLREEVQSHSVRKRYVALVSSAHLATGKHILETFAAGRAKAKAKAKASLDRRSDSRKPSSTSVCGTTRARGWRRARTTRKVTDRTPFPRKKTERRMREPRSRSSPSPPPTRSSTRRFALRRRCPKRRQTRDE